MVVGVMGWVGYDFGQSRFCLGIWGVWQNGWLSEQDGGTYQIKVNPTHVPRPRPPLSHCTQLSTQK